MLEVKNVAIATKRGPLVEALSFAVDDGETLCVTGGDGAGKSLLMRAIMGLYPLTAGHVSVDGELLTPLSACVFRRLMAFVPQEAPLASGTVESMLRLPFALEANRSVPFSKRGVLDQWQLLGLDESLYARPLGETTPRERMLALLSVAGMMGKGIVLVDDIATALGTDGEALAADYLRRLAQGGVSVLAVTRSDSFAQLLDRQVALPTTVAADNDQCYP